MVPTASPPDQPDNTDQAPRTDADWAEWYASTRRQAAEHRARSVALQRAADLQWAAWYRSTHPTLASATTNGRPRPRRVLRGTAGFFVLLACLVVPWLFPWSSQPDNAVAADPPSLRESSEERPATPTTEAEATPPPDANAVRRLLEATRTQALGYDMPVSAKELAAVSTKPGPYRKLGRLRIPSLSLDVSYGGGVFAEALDRGPGHWPGTPAPGSAGNAVISGHRNTHTRPFKELDELRPGDQIITSYENRSPVTFEVVKTTIVPEAEYRDFVLRQPSDPKARVLTLFACHPEGNPVFRIVVEARAQR